MKYRTRAQQTAWPSLDCAAAAPPSTALDRWPTRTCGPSGDRGESRRRGLPAGPVGAEDARERPGGADRVQPAGVLHRPQVVDAVEAGAGKVWPGRRGACGEQQLVVGDGAVI